jgi:23S rRNA (adenine2503-C2)-methyltransferase
VINLYALTFEEFKTQLVEMGLKPFAATQIFDWVYRKRVENPQEWSNVSNDLKERFSDHFSLDLPKIVWHGESMDGTRKFLLKMEDGQTIESVVIPSKERRTLCVSSQVGCAIGCKFCHTGTQGLTRHLKTNEIVGQYLVVSDWLKARDLQKLSNIVYMGQGEPLHNYDNIKKTTELLLETKGLGLGQRRITLSTSGLVPQIKKLHDFPPVNLAISLHSARDDVRSSLMPINKVYDLERLFEAIRSIPLKASRRVTYEYILIKGLNDSDEDARALAKLLNRFESKVNLIPFNEYPDSPYKRPSAERIESFQQTVIRAGHTCTIRISKGDDILAACGQLKSEFEKLNLWEQVKKDEVVAEKKLGEYR